MAAPLWAESVGIIGEGWFIDAFQYHSDDFLHQLVIPGRDPKRTLFTAVFLRNICTPCRFRAVGAVFQRADDALYPRTAHPVQCFSIHTRRHAPLIGVDIPICQQVELRVVQVPVKPLELVR